MITIEFPADRTDIAIAFGKALLEIGGTEHKGAVVTGITQATESTDAVEALLQSDCVEIATQAEVDAGTDSDDGAIETTPSLFGSPLAVAASQQGEPEVATVVIEGRTDVDANGIAKDDRYCATAKQPFYSSGKRKGQWKKRQGVSDEAYDAWYASQLEPGAAQTTVDEQPVATAGAFGAVPAQQTPTEPVPKTAGEFFGWCAAQQTSGAFTSENVGEAYVAANVDPSVLFTAPPEAQAEQIAKVYEILTGLGA